MSKKETQEDIKSQLAKLDTDKSFLNESDKQKTKAQMMLKLAKDQESKRKGKFVRVNDKTLIFEPK